MSGYLCREGMHMWLSEPLSPEVAAALRRIARAPGVDHVAVMPDVHLSREVCVGTVIATSGPLYPHAVGSDAGCGMAAIRFRCDADLLAGDQAAAQLLQALYAAVPRARHAAAFRRAALPSGLADLPLSHSRLEKMKQRDARAQFATLGRGNHFLELQDAGALWLMVHTGSRAVGPAILAHHLQQAGVAAQGKPYLEAESPAYGQEQGTGAGGTVLPTAVLFTGAMV